MMGYNSLYIIQNFGTLCWLVFVTPVIWMTTTLIVAIFKGELKNIKVMVNR
jgi:hypothetical protein